MRVGIRDGGKLIYNLQYGEFQIKDEFIMYLLTIPKQ